MRFAVRELAVLMVLAVTPASADASLAFSDEMKAVISGDCHAKGEPLYGKVKVVEHFADLDVKVVDHFPDLKVKWVEHFPDKCGLWKRVDHFPDLTIRFVEHFADVEIKLVDHFPGMP